jgi:hypothetical protein
MSYSGKKKLKWLLFIYSVPSKPVSNRVRIWRRLAKTGAIKLKGAVYILPYSEEHYEFLQWLDSEVTSLKGDGTLIVAEKIETMSRSEIINLFNQQRALDYKDVWNTVWEIERKISSMKKGTGTHNTVRLSGQFDKCLKEFENLHRVDFFSSPAGTELKKKIRALGSEFKEVSGITVRSRPAEVVARRIDDYRGRTWATRKNPFVDRMASAWLVRRFVDIRAMFQFIDEKELNGLDKNSVAFDMRGGEFTHTGDRCTFEVLVKSFGLKDKTLKRIAGIVHELDIKDEKFKNAEAAGIEEILTGIRKTAKTDAEALEKGMAVFEMLYASLT